jgi:hypothetical protein
MLIRQNALWHTGASLFSSGAAHGHDPEVKRCGTSFTTQMPMLFYASCRLPVSPDASEGEATAKVIHEERNVLKK